ncbi:hypothetical protein DCS_00637 [Drechmeria coniospora]|uniref:BTB domain-containing protein n=1 Tax=Drechmeria coniospora TaxID=98403 RepID=A0A151GQX1_DRECN|nr:hypothetical protein DCS_00637 [Drechmeria coniospora]KYK59507.1 hypothetical protein DCS_00637 [Drechmeria coniospora]
MPQATICRAPGSISQILLTKQVEVSLPSNGPKALESPIILFIVGAQGVRFHVHRDIFRNLSAFRYCMILPITGSNIVRFEDVDPCTFPSIIFYSICHGYRKEVPQQVSVPSNFGPPLSPTQIQTTDTHSEERSIDLESDPLLSSGLPICMKDSLDAKACPETHRRRDILVSTTIHSIGLLDYFALVTYIYRNTKADDDARMLAAAFVNCIFWTGHETTGYEELYAEVPKLFGDMGSLNLTVLHSQAS